VLEDLLDSPIAFHRCLALLASSVAGGVMLSQAVYWTKRSSGGDGWFYKTQEEWEEETMLSRYEQEGIRKRLRTTAFWKEELRGVPAKLFYRIDMQELRLALQASMRKNPKLVSGKTTNKIGEKPQALRLTETTTETTQRVGAAKPAAHPKRRSLPMSEDFALTADMEQFAKDRHVREPRREFEHFLEHHRARGSLFRDWAAAWRTWVMNCQKFNPNGVAPKENLVEQRDRLEKKYGIG